MRELIDKAVVAAEIKRRINGLKDCHADTVPGYAGEISGLERLLSFLDTLEVKEVDLNKEVANWWKDHYKKIKNDYKFEGYNGHYMENTTIVSLVQYFFELGLNFQSKDIIEALRMEYEKGRADVIADTLSWLANVWPKYCSNQTIIEGFKKAIKD